MWIDSRYKPLNTSLVSTFMPLQLKVGLSNVIYLGPFPLREKDVKVLASFSVLISALREWALQPISVLLIILMNF